MRVALFSTCIVDAMYPRVAQATVDILEGLGHEVVFPQGQTCCSQMHVNSGYFDDAYPIVKNHVKSFEEWDFDAIVAPSGSCVASLGHQQPMIAERAGDTATAQAATSLAARSFELSQFLIDVCGITNAAEQLGSYFPEKVTYHSSCHGMRLLGLGTRQEDLIRTVEGLEYTQIEGLDQCCGFGGTFSFKNADTSGAMVADKVENIEKTGASVCTGGDASCLMNIGGALSRKDSAVRTVHYAEILASTKDNPLKVDGPVAVTAGGK
ncbi:(Fe-S)-binding protein [Rothia sp. P5766]|uniref:(Fe-S)-binding protein n=1 Tax=unclassified Rothia (in: high G+C Gram-positive bacteria) TaxID=2689056 RepID=UPI003ACB81B5